MINLETSCLKYSAHKQKIEHSITPKNGQNAQGSQNAKQHKVHYSQNWPKDQNNSRNGQIWFVVHIIDTDWKLIFDIIEMESLFEFLW